MKKFLKNVWNVLIGLSAIGGLLWFLTGLSFPSMVQATEALVFNHNLKQFQEAISESDSRIIKSVSFAWEEAELKASEEEIARLKAEERAEEAKSARLYAEELVELEEQARIDAENKIKQEVKARLEVEKKIEEEEKARIEAENSLEQAKKDRKNAENKAEEEAKARAEAEEIAEALLKEKEIIIAGVRIYKYTPTVEIIDGFDYDKFFDDYEKATYAVGEHVQLGVEFWDINPNKYISDEEILNEISTFSFESSNPQIATVENDGSIMCISKGSTIIRVETPSGYSDEVEVTVY